VKRKFHARFLGGRGRVNRLRLPSDLVTYVRRRCTFPHELPTGTPLRRGSAPYCFVGRLVWDSTAPGRFLLQPGRRTYALVPYQFVAVRICRIFVVAVGFSVMDRASRRFTRHLFTSCHGLHSWHHQEEKDAEQMTRSNFSLEPPAAGPSVCGGAGRFVAPGLRRTSVSGGCGSVPRWAVAYA